eukprot:4439554-Pyramimonas_sp.AAC.1
MHDAGSSSRPPFAARASPTRAAMREAPLAHMQVAWPSGGQPAPSKLSLVPLRAGEKTGWARGNV